MTKVFGPHNKIEAFDLFKFKKAILEDQEGLCAYTQDLASASDGEVIYSRFSNRDVFVSNIGLRLLRQVYGESYINKLIVDSVVPDREEFDGQAD
jgi:hypothetical protein